jgi:hypothetical protein
MPKSTAQKNPLGGAFSQSNFDAKTKEALVATQVENSKAFSIVGAFPACFSFSSLVLDATLNGG